MNTGTLDVLLLGPLEVRRDGIAIPLPRSKKTRALLGYLAATGRPHGRAHLCDLLWDGPADPRAALRWSLSKLRIALEGDGITRLLAEGDRVGFEPAGARVDLVEIRAALGPERADTPIELLEVAADRFRGEFLEGLDLTDCYRFDAWCTAEREAARALRGTILATLVQRLAGEPERALRFARDRLALDPLVEDAHIAVIKLLAAIGSVHEAVAQFERCSGILQRELGARPSSELAALGRSLLPRRPTTPSPPATPATTALPALVGRTAERDVLKELIATAGGGRTREVLLLVGEPGIGKTRLLEELAALVRADGGEVIAGRAFEAERVRPYGAWIDILHAIPTREIPTTLRPRLAPLLPELGPSGSDIGDRNRLFEAVVQLLAGRADDRTVAIILDDIQWADEPSTALLHLVARRTADSRVLLACAARRADLEDNPAARGLLRDLRREGRLRVLELTPLGHDQIRQLVHGIDPGLDADTIFADSGGSPLFAIELVRARQQGQSELPRTLDGLIGDRLDHLDTDARNLLPWVAALGGGFGLDALARVTELPAMELLRGIEALERRGILQPIGDCYEFTHDLIREVAYCRLSEPRRRLIHTRIARALSAGGIPDGDAAEAVAHHAALAGDDALAARACIVAGWHCLGMFAWSEGATLAGRGMMHTRRLPPGEQLPLRLRLLELYAHPGMAPHRMPDLKGELVRTVEEARAAGRSATEASGLYLISILQYQSGDFGDALENTLRAEVAARGSDPETVVRAIAETARCLGLLEREMPRAERLAAEARSLAGSLALESDFHQIPMAFGLLRHHSGDLDEAIRCFERAAALARRANERWWEGACLSRLVMIELERGQPQDALTRCRDLIELARRLGEGSDAPFAEALRALALLQLDEPGATEQLNGAVQDLERVDSRWMIAYVQSFAARVDLLAGRIEAARRRAEQALTAAAIVGRPSGIALARALLADLDLAAGDRQSAAAQVGPSRAVLSGHVLSARARSAVEAVARRVAEIPT